MAGLNSVLTIRKEDYRPCLVEGRDALFHRWVEIEQLILKCDYRIRSEQLHILKESYEATGIAPYGLRTEKIKSVAAIVEFEDGTVAEIEPKKIQFLDTGSIMCDDPSFSEEWKNMLRERFNNG